MPQAGEQGEPTAAAPLAELIGADLRVPLAQGGTSRYVNLDIAASGPCLGVVAERVAEVMPYYSSVHRGSGYLSLVCTALYEQARADVADSLGARPDDVVIFTRNTTDGLNLLSRSLPPGEVVFFDLEHHADLLPWQTLAHRCLPTPPTIAELAERLDDALSKRPALLLAITAASNVTGEVLPVAELAEIAHAHGARVVVDAAQLAPHRTIELEALGADYLALSGHKCYAPFGSGVLVGRRDWLDAAPPYLRGGGAVNDVTIAATSWAESPDRHEGGTPNPIGALALARAMAELRAIGGKAMAEHDAALRSRLLAGLESLPALRPLRIFTDSTDAIGVVAVAVEGAEPALLAAYLSSEWGIGVREGRFCAHPLLARLNHGENALRISAGVGTTIADVEQLLEALRSFFGDGPRLDYVQHGAFFEPQVDLRQSPFPGLDLSSGPETPCRR